MGKPRSDPELHRVDAQWERRSVLGIAAEKGDARVVEELLHSGECRVDDSDVSGARLAALHWATSVRLWLGRLINAVLDGGGSPEVLDARGRTPLNLAAERANVEASRALLSRGANINVQDVQGCTPLQYAAHRYETTTVQHVEVVSLFLRRGADETLVDEDGLTPYQGMGIDLGAGLENLLSVSDRACAEEISSAPHR